MVQVLTECTKYTYMRGIYSQVPISGSWLRSDWCLHDVWLYTDIVSTLAIWLVGGGCYSRVPIYLYRDMIAVLHGVCMVFAICRWLTVYHSCELNRLTRKSTTLTPIKAKATHIQMSDDNGCRKEKTSGLELMGFFIIILTPKLMKGFVKSMISSRDDVIVRGARAISAFYINKRSK